MARNLEREKLMEYFYGNGWSKEEILDWLLSGFTKAELKRMLRELERMDSQ